MYEVTLRISFAQESDCERVAANIRDAIEGALDHHKIQWERINVSTFTRHAGRVTHTATTHSPHSQSHGSSTPAHPA
jgi:hypothetical protein